MSVISWLIAVSFVLILTAGIASAATETYKISYSGKLTNAAGTPLTGTYNVTFRLYNVSSGGAALATDPHNITASGGQFTTTLNFPAPNYNGQQLYVSLQRSPDPEKSRTVIYPVPYALGLRPGAIITGSGASPVLQLVKSGTGGVGLNVSTSGTHNSGVVASTSGRDSDGVSVITTGVSSVGMSAMTTGIASDGVRVVTQGDSSDGISSITMDDSSHGLHVFVYGKMSKGVNVFTGNDDSDGVLVKTNGINSPGFAGETAGDDSDGVHASVTGTNSRGVYAYSSQNYGVYGEGVSSAGVRGQSSTAAGVYGRSQNENGIYAVTDREDDKYGIYTPDYLFAKGTQVPAADVAEYMPVSEDVGPGTVMVIGDDGRLRTTTVAYDTGIAGIVSTAPGVSLGTKEDGNPGEEIIAVAGRVPCKVDTSNGPIHPRDLLTSSRNPGYAMKATNPRVGTVLGKAMGSLESGTGTIEVLVALQ